MPATVTLTIFLFSSFLTLSYAKSNVAIQDRPLCVASTGQWAPFNLIRKGKLDGIGIDMWQEVAARLGLSYRYEVKDSWKEVLDALKEKRCDLTVATHLTPSRKNYTLASRPYADYPIVIVTRQNVGFVDDIEQISDRPIALPRFYATTETLLQYHPRLHVVYTQNIDEALEKVAKNEAYATVGGLPVVAYKITNGLHQLKIAGKTRFRFPVSFLVRSELKPLLKKINQTIGTIPIQRIHEINRKWMQYPATTTFLNRWVYALALVTLVITVILGWYVFRLRKAVKKKERVEKKWRMIAQKDQLTGVYTRRYVIERFLQMLKKAKKDSSSFGLVFFDIDYLKEINDIYGHEMGDIAIQRIVKTVKERIRPGDILGRWGGDEFIILFADMDESDVHVFTDRIEKSIERMHLKDGFRLSASFGWAVYRKGDTRHSMLQRADARLYEMKKRHHRNRPPIRKQVG